MGERAARGAGSYALPALQYTYDRRHPAFEAEAGRRRLAANFCGEALRAQLAQEAMLCAAASGSPGDVSEELGIEIPASVGAYHTLLPLDEHADAVSSALGVGTLVFKGVSSRDGLPYALYRLEPSHAVPSTQTLDAAKREVARWKALGGSTGLVPPRDAFVSRDVEGEAALFFAFDYIADAQTLEEAHGGAHPPSEDRLWSYLVQATATLSSVHAAGLTLGSGVLHPTKALVGPDGRLRLSWCGVRRAIGAEGTSGDAAMLQCADVGALGRMLLALALGATVDAVGSDLAQAVGTLERSGRLGAPLVRVLWSAASGEATSASALLPLLGPHALRELEARSVQADALRADLAAEVGSGRLARLLIKMDMVLDRYDDHLDPSYAVQAGDKHLLRCFRDFAFHQVRDGRPDVDWGHVVESLNKVDVGAAERMMLSSRENERSVLVASFADVRHAVQGCYADLERRAAGGAAHADGPRRAAPPAL
eukprot:PRCOL_00006835-RA